MDFAGVFKHALKNGKQDTYKIAGMPALVDYASIVPVTHDGATLYSATLKSADATAEVRFKPITRYDGNKLTYVFKPSSATVTGRSAEQRKELSPESGLAAKPRR